MSVVDPTIDELLAVTDENRFLLCEIAARRARDINDMMRNQHSRAEQLAEIDDISAFMCDDEGRSPNPLSIAFDEIAPHHAEDAKAPVAGDLSYDHAFLTSALGLSTSDEPDEEDAENVTVEDLVDDLVASLDAPTDTETEEA